MRAVWKRQKHHCCLVHSFLCCWLASCLYILFHLFERSLRRFWGSRGVSTYTSSLKYQRIVRFTVGVELTKRFFYCRGIKSRRRKVLDMNCSYNPESRVISSNLCFCCNKSYTWVNHCNINHRYNFYIIIYNHYNITFGTSHLKIKGK